MAWLGQLISNSELCIGVKARPGSGPSVGKVKVAASLAARELQVVESRQALTVTGDSAARHTSFTEHLC